MKVRGKPLKAYGGWIEDQYNAWKQSDDETAKQVLKGYSEAVAYIN